MKPKNKVILLLVLTIIPTIITIVSAPMSINGTIELDSVFQTDLNPLLGQKGFFKLSSNFFNIEYQLYGEWHTNYNFAELIWERYNGSHYNLSIAFISRNNNSVSVPPYLITYNVTANITLQNTFSVGNVYIPPYYYVIDADDVNSSDPVYIGIFTLVQWEKYRATVEASFDTTIDSDSGDVFASGQTTFQMTLLDTVHYLDFYVFISFLMLISIMFIIILPVCAVIIWRRRERYF